MEKEQIKEKLKEVENLIWDFYRGKENLLTYTEMYIVLDLLEHLVFKNYNLKKGNIGR